MEEENKIEKKEVIRPKKVNNNKDGSVIIGIIAALFIGAALMYILIYFVFPKESGSTVINKSEKEVTVTDEGIADAVEKLYDAVVVVEVYSNDNLIASGTGFVYKTDNKKAYILTNNHVVSIDNTKVTPKVIFTDGKEIEADIEGADEYSDLAVLSVGKDDIIAVAEIGTSEDMRLGDTVFTIGAPLDTEYYWTVTRGVMSGKDRMVEVSSSNSQVSDCVMRVLQTDASINSGNSGGPLANSNGQVIGITNMKLVSSGVEGIGFAIPIEDAIEFADTIISGETIKRPLLGVSMINLDERLALYKEGITLNTELQNGAVVVQVQASSPASSAGLKRGDIITAIDDVEVKNVATLKYNLYKHKVGDKITLTYERNGKIETATVKLSVASE